MTAYAVHTQREPDAIAAQGCGVRKAGLGFSRLAGTRCISDAPMSCAYLLSPAGNPDPL